MVKEALDGGSRGAVTTYHMPDGQTHPALRPSLVMVVCVIVMNDLLRAVLTTE